MALRQTIWLCRSLVPHGNSSVAARIPADVRRDLEIESGESVDYEYNRAEQTLTIHFDRDED